MRRCLRCGHHLTRARRTAFERLACSDAFRCHHCHARERRMRRPLRGLAFLLSVYTSCPRCRRPDVEPLRKRDRIDTMSRHPASVLQRMTGAPLYRCAQCRLQYYDWRPQRVR